RRISTTGRELPQSVMLPAQFETSPIDYHWIVPEGYQSVGWTFTKSPALVCNGIIVSKTSQSAPPLEETDSPTGKVTVRMPSISVFDRDGKLPLTLDRLKVDLERVSFLDVLRADVLRNIAAYLIVCAPGDLRKDREFDITEDPELCSHPAIAAS